MELFKEKENYSLGIKRSSRKAVFDGTGEATVSCHIHVPAKHSQVVGCSDGKIVVWKPRNDYKADVHKTTIQGHLGQIFQFLYLAEGSTEENSPGLLVSCSADRTIKVWDIWDRDLKKKCVQSLVAHGGSVTNVAFVKGYLLSCSTDGTVRVWKSDNARSLLLYPWFEVVQIIGREDGLRACPVSLNVLRRTESTSFFVGDAAGRVHPFVPPFPPIPKQHFTAQRSQKIHTLSVTHLMVVPQESFIVTLSFDNTVQVHDALSGNGFFAIENPTRCRYTGVVWDTVHQELVLVDQLGYLQVWNVYVEKCLQNAKISDTPLVSVNLGDSRIYVGDADGVSVWRVHRSSKFKEFKGHEGAVTQLVLVGQNVYSASLDMSIRCWDAYDMSCLGILEERSSEISSMLFIPGSIIIVTGHDDGRMKLWNIDSGSSMTLEHHKNTVSCLTVAPTQKRDFLLSGSFDGTIAVWDISKRRAFNPLPEQVIRASNNEVLCVCYHPRLQAILVGGNNADITAWSLWTHEQTGKLVGHTDAVTCMLLDGNFIISGSDDHTIKIWDDTHMFLVATLSGHSLAVRDLILVPTVGLLVSCSFDGHILVWDYVSQEVVLKLHHQKEFRCLLFNEQEKQLYAGTEQDNIMIIQLPPQLLEVPYVDYSSAAQHLEDTSNKLTALLGLSTSEFKQLKHKKWEQFGAPPRKHPVGTPAAPLSPARKLSGSFDELGSSPLPPAVGRPPSKPSSANRSSRPRTPKIPS